MFFMTAAQHLVDGYFTGLTVLDSTKIVFSLSDALGKLMMSDLVVEDTICKKEIKIDPSADSFHAIKINLGNQEDLENREPVIESDRLTIKGDESKFKSPNLLDSTEKVMNNEGID